MRKQYATERSILSITYYYLPRAMGREPLPLATFFGSVWPFGTGAVFFFFFGIFCPPLSSPSPGRKVELEPEECEKRFSV